MSISYSTRCTCDTSHEDVTFFITHITHFLQLTTFSPTICLYAFSTCPYPLFYINYVHFSLIAILFCVINVSL